MQLVIKNGKVLATHNDGQDVADKYPGCEIVTYSGTVEHGDDDPRTPEEKRLAYRDQRRLAYPSLAEQLDMIYWDRVQGTTVWQDAISTVKNRFPKVTT